MSPKYLTVVLAYVLVGLFFVSADSIEIYNRPSPLVPPPTPAVMSVPTTRVMAKIGEGLALLKSTGLLLYETKKGQPSELARKQIALAVWDQNTDKVFEKRVWVKEDDIKKFKSLPSATTLQKGIYSDILAGAIKVKPAVATESLDIQPRWWNSFNSYYESDQPGFVVVANKYLMPSEYLAGLPEKSRGKYTDIVYVPYSKALHTPEVVENGKIYVKDIVDSAYRELESDKVVSRSNGQTLVTASINKDFVKNIILVEHIDPDAFGVSADQGRELIERVLAIIGSNHQLAYRYTGSPAGASGLAQFIEPTYKRIAAQYPRAGLVKDYNLGMADHVNAVKAMVLFFDAHKDEMARKIKNRKVAGQLGITEEMLAAAYNGGSTRVIRSVNKYGLAWISQQFDLPKTKRIFRAETLGYIKKFRSVKELRIFD